MPNITIDGPVIKEIATKRTLVEEITRVASQAYALPKEAFVVVIKENPLENVGVGGILLADRHK